MEYDRSAFEQPSSVVKIGVAGGSNPAKLAYNGQNAIYEYFKKGFEPTEYDWSNYKLPAPSNLSATVGNGKIVLSWGSVNPGEAAKPEYGRFGYNIYKDVVLLDWTDKTSYTHSAGNIYGTYKVVATYKSYSGLQSSEAVLKVEEEKPKPKPEPEEPETPSSSDEPTTNP